MPYENTPHNCTCRVCNKTFYRPPSHIAKRGAGNYCSRACLWQSKKSKTKEQSTRWKGGRTTSRGYVMLSVPDHPKANSRGYVAEHRLVAERMVGRPLLRSEIVHHINGQKADNDPANLRVMSQAEHARLHHK